MSLPSRIALHRADVPMQQIGALPEPFASKLAGRERARLGEAFGLTNFGVNLTRLPPGASSSLRHAHLRQDEFVYVLEGHPTLITDDGESVLAPGMFAGFPAGTGNAHHLVNRSAAPVLYLEIGDRTRGDVVTYPDDDVHGFHDATGQFVYTHKDGSPL